MKNFLTITLTLLLVLFATTALADRRYGHGDHDGYHTTQGERIDRHLDRKGDMIERRFDHKADRAEANGKYRKADRLRTKGERINRHLDRKGDRIHARHDTQQRHHVRAQRYVQVQPRVAYRDYDHRDNYFNLMIHQPGLLLGWGWRH